MSFIDYIKKHLGYLILTLIFIIGTGFFLLLLPINNAIEVESQEIKLFGISLDNWEIWITVIGAVIASVWAMYQYTKTEALRQQEKASEIAKSFATTLTNKCNIICTVIEKSSLNEVLDFKNKDCFCFSTFNTNEIRRVYDDDNFISKYKEAKKKADLNTVYYNVLESLISLESLSDIRKSHTTYETQQARKLFILDNSSLPFLFDVLVCDVLNELEYLCMFLSSQVAGSKYVYQSLHQVFLRTVRVLAVEISISNNKSYSDKYFTNLISVYNEWKILYSKGLKKENKLKEQIENILNPKIKTV